jgi:hypothetical protein
MSVDPMKLVKFVCVAKAHADGRSASALTIHAGAWAFCPRGGDGTDHDWQASDGLALTDALRLTPRRRAADPAPAQAARRGSTAAKGRARPR